MNEAQWEAFQAFRNSYKELCDQWNTAFAEELKPLQKAASIKDTPEYPIETPVVYNTAYDSFTKDDEITLLVIGDNPGKEEQLSKNRKYLVGQSGRIAEGFFRRHPEFHTDFRKNVIIMNKTPVHTAKTSHLKYLKKNGSEQIKNLIQESQILMAKKAAQLHQALLKNCMGQTVPQLWLVGYAELKKNGIFASYREELKQAYTLPDGKEDTAWDKVFVYQHFSMNRFLVDLKNYQAQNMGTDLPKALEALGHLHRDEIFKPNGD